MMMIMMMLSAWNSLSEGVLENYILSLLDGMMMWAAIGVGGWIQLG